MNVMIKSDLITMKNAALSLTLMPVVVAVLIVVMMGSLVAGASALAVMVPFMYLFSISAYDELNGWERFRLTLPITRRQVAFGRYASTLIVVAICVAAALLFSVVVIGITSLLPPNLVIPGATPEANPPEVVIGAVCAVTTLILVVAALTYPLIMRFGMTKGTRLAPIALILLCAAAFWFVGDSGILDSFITSEMQDDLWNHVGSTAMLVSGACIAGALLLYALSALLSAHLYERREF